MADNPLFPTQDTPPDNADGLATPSDGQQVANPAADLIRSKLEKIYASEPDTKQEIVEAETVRHRSKHQQFMYELSTSGKSLAEIQTKWHEYYSSLPDNEKHEVWQEFYAANGEQANIISPTKPTESSPTPEPTKAQPTQHEAVVGQVETADKPKKPEKRQRRANTSKDKRTKSEIKQAVLSKVSAGGKLKAKHHLQSLAFGLIAGLIVLFVFLFGFFNEVIIAPFIQPARAASSTPIIIDPASVAVGNTPEIIIPKINLQIPLDFSVTSTNEALIENALENGIVHYPTTVLPGQTGNSAFFGHSSNNIFNKGKYKFAFVLLHKLEIGDVFYITNNGKVYIYKVSSKKIVQPSQVDVLNDIEGKTATATLITCDPPGTSLHRLVVVGDQISPNPDGNSTGSNTTLSSSKSAELPGNGPTLWTRFWRSVF